MTARKEIETAQGGWLVLAFSIPKLSQQAMACSKLFSFAEVVQGRDASVRVTDDGLLYAVDLAMVMTGKDRNNAGRDLRELPDETFLSTNFVDRKLPGKGCGHTKLVSFEHAIELIMVLPGKVAKETRRAFVSIIHRYLAGDKSLLKEIEDNAESSSPIAQLARATLPDPEDPEARRKRIKREDLELVKLERDIQQSEQDIRPVARVVAPVELAVIVQLLDLALLVMIDILYQRPSLDVLGILRHDSSRLDLSSRCNTRTISSPFSDEQV